MKKLNEIFITILNSALRSVPIEENADMQSLTFAQWQELINMAQSHKVLPMFYDVVCHLPAFQEQDAVLKSSLRRTILQQLSLQTIRTTEFLRLNKAWQEQGIRPIVVKGLVCRYIYPKLDLRLSSDEDVLVAPEQYESTISARKSPPNFVHKEVFTPSLARVTASFAASPPTEKLQSLAG